MTMHAPRDNGKSPLQSIWEQLNELRKSHVQDFRPKCVRVNPLAPAGSIVLVPMTPDRARPFLERDGLAALAQMDLLEQFSHPAWPREILMHPQDWNAVIRKLADRDDPEREVIRFGPLNGGAVTLFGIPVVQE